MTKQQCFPSTQIAAASQHHPIIAIVHRTRLVLRSSVDGAILRSVQSDPEFAAGCKLLRWYDHRRAGQTLPSHDDTALAPSRLLLASDDKVHVLDASDSKWHATINHASSDAGKLANVDFGSTCDEILVFSDFGIRVTVWSLLTSRGVEIKDPKFSTRGYGFRPRTGHLAILTRETTRDVVMVLAPGTRELVHSFALGTVDAQGLKWSPDGRWLVTWEAASAGYNVLIYTPDGHLFTAFSGGQDMEHPGLGVRNVEWDPSGRFLAVGCYENHVTLLSTTTFSPIAILNHNTTISSPHASIWSEQIDAFRQCSYTLALQPACAPHQLSAPDKQPTPGISHLSFNAEGTLLASRSSSIPTTVFIWSTDSLHPVAILIHHSPVRSLQWSTQDPSLLLIHCATEAPLTHFWGATWDSPRILPMPLSKVGGRTEASWVHTPNPDRPTAMLANAHNYTIRTLVDDPVPESVARPASENKEFVGLGPEDMFDEGNSMDLSPIKLNLGQLAMGMGMGMGGGVGEMGDEEGEGEELDDTFDYRRRLVSA